MREQGSNQAESWTREPQFPGGCSHPEILSSTWQEKQACLYRHAPNCSSGVWTLQCLGTLVVSSEGLGPVTDPGSSLCPLSSQNQVSILTLGTDSWVMLEPTVSLHSPHRRRAGCQSPRPEGSCDSRGALSQRTLSLVGSPPSCKEEETAGTGARELPHKYTEVKQNQGES